MKRLATLGGLLALATAAHAGELDPTLVEVLDGAQPDQSIRTLVYLEQQIDLTQLDRDFKLVGAKRDDRIPVTVTALQDLAADTQPDLLAHLDELVAGDKIKGYQPLWIVNAVALEASRAIIEGLADHPDVGRIYYDFEIGNDELPAVEGDGGNGGGIAGGPEPGIIAVRAPEVWALGITGQGVLVATLDTGVDGNHPALASRWRGLDPAYAGNPEWAWFDPVTNTTFPQSFGSHGTHTMGSVCGGLPGNEVGVAPGAEWIHAAVIDRVSIAQTVADAILSFQWMLDPDENPGTTFDVPHVCSNSWGLLTAHGYPNCDETFWTFLDACEAAGIVMLFSAGNEGSSGLRRPADRATDEFRTVAVAAVNATNPVPPYPIAGFSSRGPTQCTPDGSSAIKPDIAAPGENVISSVPGGGYGSLSGTSMASPHVNGVVALMLEANPDLAVDEIKQIIYDTALDQGAPGEDNDYGYGMIDAFEAVNQALSGGVLTFTFPSGFPEFLDPNGGTAIPVIVSGQSITPDPGTGVLYYSTDGQNYTQVAMSEGQPNEYTAVFPSFPCGSQVTYYFSADSTEGNTSFSPFSAPASTYSGLAYSGMVVDFSDDFEQELGWTTEVLDGATSGFWERGAPVDDPGWAYDPPSDGDGSGRCFVTQNELGNTDVDDGAVRLTSPQLDMSGGDIVLAYEYYVTLTDSNSTDRLLVELSSSGLAGPWTTIADYVTDGGTSWHHAEHTQAELEALGLTMTADMRLRFTANDSDPQSINESGVDGIQIFRLVCDGGCTWDLDGDGSVGITDLLDLLASWDAPYGINDLLDLLANWGPCP